jgi:hypothetical protein
MPFIIILIIIAAASLFRFAPQAFYSWRHLSESAGTLSADVRWEGVVRRTLLRSSFIVYVLLDMGFIWFCLSILMEAGFRATYILDAEDFLTYLLSWVALSYLLEKFIDWAFRDYEDFVDDHLSPDEEELVQGNHAA